jgi:hypothetical protein
LRKTDLAIRLWAKVDRRGPDECWLFTGHINADGYGRIGEGRKLLSAHRAAWIVTHGPIPESDASQHGTVVMHVCDNPACCNPAHLKLGTQRENNADRKAKGRNGDHRGDTHWKARLTRDQVLEIRRMTGTDQEIAEKFGMSVGSIYGIRTNRTWRHI